MSSPFPGMDPYLENPARWPDVQQGLIGSMRAILNTLLPAGYVANMGERCQIVPTERSIYPDAFVRKQSSPPPVSGRRSGAAAVAPVPDTPLIVEEMSLEPREVFLEIRNVADMQNVVAVIEVLSATNKAPGSRERDRYVQKQREILSSRTHLIEIDFLRSGMHTVAVPAPLPSEKREWRYIACLHRGGEGRRFEVWPCTLRESLPCIAVPLGEGEPAVGLDLQAVFDRNYDEGAYGLQIDYSGEPIPPLNDEETAWADSLLREQGLRG